MNQQSVTAKARDNFRKIIRKKELEKKFEEHRKNWKIEQRKSQEEEFYRIYPHICDENYIENIPFILQYSCNDSYNFMLLPLIGYTYEDLLRNPQSEYNYLILEVLTQFEEIELPQTEELVQTLMNSLPKRGKVVLNIIVNLLQHHKYAQILRDLLLEANFMSYCEQVLSSYIENENEISSTNTSELVSLYFCICCEFIQSHPPLPFKQFTKICSTLANLVKGEQEKYLLFQALYNISNSFLQSLQRAQVLYNLFNRFLHSQYFSFEEESIQFIIYCIRSKLYIEPIFQKLLAGSLQSHNEQIRSKVVVTFKLLINNYQEFQRQEIYQQLKETNFIGKIRNLLISSREFIHYDCLQCLQKLARLISVDKKDHEPLNQLIIVITESLESSEQKIVIKALHIVLIILQTAIDEEQNDSILVPFGNYQLGAKMQQLRTQNQEVNSLLQRIQIMMSTLIA